MNDNKENCFQCPICLNDEIDYLCIFQCSHYVCSNCISGFLFLNNDSRTCPLCRKPVHLILIMTAEDIPKSGIKEFIFGIYGNFPQNAHKRLIPTSLREVLKLPNLNYKDIFAISSVLIRTCDRVKIARSVLDSLSKCPICSFRDMAVETMLNHLNDQHDMYICMECYSPRLTLPFYYQAFSLIDYMFKHLHLFHENRNNFSNVFLLNQVEYIRFENRYLRPFWL